MRASSRRATHSVPVAPGRVTALEGEPLVLQAGEGDGHPAGAERVAAASASTVVMPLSSRWPRTTRAAAASSSPLRARSASCRPSRGAPQLRAVVVDGLDPAPVQQGCPQLAPLVPRRRHDQRGQQVVQVVGRGGLRERSRRAPASMASGSRAPMEVRSTLRPRRSRTALVRRFWNSSSSRKA